MKELRVHPAPFLQPERSTPQLMRELIYTLIPVIAVAVWTFGIGALLVIAAATLGALVTEWALFGRSAIGDASALLTGLLLGLTLPPGFPLWMAALGGIVSIALGKAVWGGLGQNLFNPALVGRAFLQGAFPIAITTFSPPRGFFDVSPRLWAMPLMKPVDGLSGATPLNRMKFEHEAADLSSLVLGDTAGSLGETGALVIACCGLFLAFRSAFDWRLPVGMIGSVFVLSSVFWLLSPEAYPTPWFTVMSGGLMFGAVFMATDPVTTPTVPRGAWAFGIGAGALVVLIRLWGGLPEGVMYAILLMNAATPLLERHLQPKPFGRPVP